jgi:hypothetical protein
MRACTAKYRAEPNQIESKYTSRSRMYEPTTHATISRRGQLGNRTLSPVAEDPDNKVLRNK